VRLAEHLGATVLTDLKAGAAFPTDHPLHGPAPGLFLTPAAVAVLKAADVVLSLDWIDLAGTARQAWGTENVGAKVIQVSVDQFVHNGWSMDHQGLAPMDLYLLSEPEAAVPSLVATLRTRGHRARPAPLKPPPAAAAAGIEGRITIPLLAEALQEVVAGESVSLLRLPIGWAGELWHFRDPLDYIGYDGGGGIGSGPGMAVGEALALRGTGRLPIAILGDGDYLMGLTALWTAANARVPLLLIVANNNSFFNDELHQERVARERGRPIENRWIGQRIADPEPDLALLARGQGLEGFGPVEKPEALSSVLAAAVALVRLGKPCVVDVRVAAGYSAAVSASITRGADATG
jgi:thiamine pyrophosphate-dependent acetolactate synthase large subunit-like protein